MNPIAQALAYLFAFMVFGTIGILVWAYFIGRNVERREAAARADQARIRAHYATFDPAKTAGGYAGKRWGTYCAQTDGRGEGYSRGETYTGGFDAYVYPEPDHHTLAEYEAIYADRELEAPHDAATKV